MLNLLQVTEGVWPTPERATAYSPASVRSSCSPLLQSTFCPALSLSLAPTSSIEPPLLSCPKLSASVSPKEIFSPPCSGFFPQLDGELLKDRIWVLSISISPSTSLGPSTGLIFWKANVCWSCEWTPFAFYLWHCLNQRKSHFSEEGTYSNTKNCSSW